MLPRILRSCTFPHHKVRLQGLLLKYFPASRKAEILEALKTDPSKMDWSETEAGNGLKVDIYINKKNNLVFVHCAEYIPYSYQDCSDWFAFSLDQVGNLTK